jgi:hypothetical protein
MTFVMGWLKERTSNLKNDKNNGKRQEQELAGRRYTSHLSDDKTVAKMGHPDCFGWFRKDSCSRNGAVV